jgi:S-adenosylmethionine:tRNA ribosyltransferase-isomerase
MRLADLDYPLPEALIAQEPAPERAAARLLVLDRGGVPLRHARIADLPGFLGAGDVLVLNDTRVIPARVHGRRSSGGRLEILFVAPRGSDGEWEVLVRGTPRRGERVHLAGGHGEWLAPLGDGRWRLRLVLDEPVLAWLERVGEVPLPPYVRRAPTAADRERYQTVYARAPGAVASPTAGLHLTRDLLGALAAAGVRVVTLTLHVGPGTFLPIRTDDLDQHVMAPERADIPAPTLEAIGAARTAGARVVAVGTTTVRALESAFTEGALHAGPRAATLFIRPGHRFRVVDALLTNFHLPRSTLLALVAAFAGWERIRAAYAEAVRLGYRFYSYGDAMLIT